MEPPTSDSSFDPKLYKFQILYVDTDTIFLRPPEHLFQLFNEFDEDQVFIL